MIKIDRRSFELLLRDKTSREVKIPLEHTFAETSARRKVNEEPVLFSPAVRVFQILKGYHGGLDAVRLDRGWQGYENSMRLEVEDVPAGLIAWGGESQRGTCYVSLTGYGCQWFSGSQLHTMVSILDGTLTRTDIAADFLGGELTVADCRAAYHAGEFDSGIRRPVPKYIDDFDCGEGKTLYVGKRKNGKQVRCYEKGKQLGNPDSQWVRVEVEFRNRDRFLPLDILLEPARYFAGASPFCARIVESAAERIRTANVKLVHTVDEAITHARISYGQLIDWLVSELGPHMACALLHRPGRPDRIADSVVVAGHHDLKYGHVMQLDGKVRWKIEKPNKEE